VSSKGSFKFCPQCGGIMYPRRRGEEIVFYCPKCKLTVGSEGGDVSIYRMKVEIKHSPKEMMRVLGEEASSGAELIVGSVECPKCGHKEVYFWMIQTRSADEPMTRFYRCKRCGYTWREYA